MINHPSMAAMRGKPWLLEHGKPYWLPGTMRAPNYSCLGSHNPYLHFGSKFPNNIIKHKPWQQVSVHPLSTMSKNIVPNLVKIESYDQIKTLFISRIPYVHHGWLASGNTSRHGCIHPLYTPQLMAV